MVNFETFRPTEGTPIYQQILLFVKRGAVAGTIQDGDELPSRRVLSALLGINPNTVQKAFHLLEEEHLITSQLGSKSFMTLQETTIGKLKMELLSEDIRGITNALKQMGISKEEAFRLMEEQWEDET